MLYSSDTLFPTFLSFLISSEKLSQRKRLMIFFFFYLPLQLPSLQASLCFCSTLAKHHLSLKQCGLWSRLLQLFSAKYGRIRAGYIQTLLAHPALKQSPDVLCFFPNNIKECQQKSDEVGKPAVQRFSKWVLLCYEDELSSDYSMKTFAPQGKYPWLDPVVLQSRQMSLIYHCGLHTWVPAVLSCIEATERHAQYEEM